MKGINSIDFYDYDTLEKLNEVYNKQLVNLYKLYIKARDKGDEKATKLAVEKCKGIKQKVLCSRKRPK